MSYSYYVFCLFKKNILPTEMATGALIPDFQLPYTSYAYGGQNGRVNFATPTVPPPYSAGASGTSVPDSAGFAYQTKTEKSFVGDMLRGNWDKNPVADMFFTATNVKFIQDSIRKEVYTRSGSKKYTIDDQSVDELKMIMRGIYLQYAKNNPFDVKGQVQQLNSLVIEWCAPRILSEIDHYYYYLNDISHMPVPLSQPVSMSSAGTRSLPLQPFT
jgi:hypothetical protein